MPEEENVPDNSKESEEKMLAKWLETLGWALFLIMTGGLFLIPSHLVPPVPGLLV